jgi:hypothetical protein
MSETTNHSSSSSSSSSSQQHEHDTATNGQLNNSAVFPSLSSPSAPTNCTDSTAKTSTFPLDAQDPILKAAQQVSKEAQQVGEIN